MERTILIHVSGKVQGVFYRQSTKEKARAIGVTGTVSNLPDGRVQIIVTGSTSQLDQLIEWCRTGPPKAVVTTIEVTDTPLRHFDQFSIDR
jgi:acylphosphatase